MLERVCSLARVFAGEDLESAQAVVLDGLCAGAFGFLCGELCDGLLPEACADALVPAAAMLALSRLVSLRAVSENGISFSAGDIALRGGDAAQSVKLLRAQVQDLLRGLVRDGDFYFGGVRG